MLCVLFYVSKVCVYFFLYFSVPVFICFDPEPPLQPVGLKHEPTEQSLRQRAATTRAGLLKASDYISTAFSNTNTVDLKHR